MKGHPLRLCRGLFLKALFMYEGFRHYKVTRKLKIIAKAYDVKLKFKKLNGFDGEYEVAAEKIIVNLDDSSTGVISSFFHELGHHVEKITGKYKKFYSSKTPLYIQRRIALRAERSADMAGKKLCKMYFPNVKYERAYMTKEAIKFNKEYYKDGRKK